MRSSRCALGTKEGEKTKKKKKEREDAPQPLFLCLEALRPRAPHTSLSLSLTHTHSLSRTHSLTHTLSHTHHSFFLFSLSHIHSLSHTHTHTHTHTHYLHSRGPSLAGTHPLSAVESGLSIKPRGAGWGASAHPAPWLLRGGYRGPVRVCGSRQRSYQRECTGSRPITEVKRVWARLVLPWVTRRES